MDATTAMYVSQAIHGISYGMILFLIASGLNIIFGMMHVLNLAHGSFFMLAAYFCYQIVLITGNFWIALIFAPLFVAIFGVLIERVFLRWVTAFGHLGQLILTVGVGQLILGAVKIIWGTQGLPVPIPPILDGVVTLGGLEYPIYRLFIIVLALVVLGIMGLLLYKTRLGKIVRAAVRDPDMVGGLGINISLVFAAVFALGSWLAGIAGVAIAPVLTVFPGLADQIGNDAFIVVVTGGFGSLAGAFIVSIMFGLLSSFGIQFLSNFSSLLMVGVMAIILVIRPTGLFGVEE